VSTHYFESASGKVFDVKVNQAGATRSRGLFMEFHVTLKSEYESERFILLSTLGLLAAVKEGAIGIEEAETCLFSPYSVDKIKKLA
jgi:hypothetical protein